MTSERRYGLVVIAASAGGIEALVRVLSGLPADFALPIAVVQHRTTHTPDYLAEVLGRACALRVRRVEPDEVIRPGTVYLAHPDLHLMVKPGPSFGLSDGSRIRHLLSSANPLFSSAAQVYGPVIAVVLSGSGHDATDGVQEVKAAGGVVIAQDQATARSFGMPGSAIATGAVDYVLGVDAIAPMLVALAGETAAPAGA